MNNAGYIGSIATELKKTISPCKRTNVTTEEETAERKTKFLNILDKSTEAFFKKLESGEITINTTADFERIVKLTLLLSGEADSIKGKEENTEQTQSTVFSSLNPENNDITKVLNSDDPNVKAVYDIIFKKYNDANDLVK